MTIRRSECGNRPLVTIDAIDNVLSEVRARLLSRLDEKGYGGWLSRHEVSGIISEEFYEFIEATHSGSQQQIDSEITDIAVGCVFGLACSNSNTLDW